MNSRERAKKRRIEMLQNTIADQPNLTEEDFVSMLIVNFGVSKKTALEEIRAVKHFLKLNEPINSCQTKTTLKEEEKNTN